MKDKIKIIMIIGPTASGKTRLGVQIASRFSGEIISVDSRQVYKGMDIGTGKDIKEYGQVPYHLIDIAEPAETYNLNRFRNDAIAAISDVADRGKVPVLVGGSPLYIDSLLSQYSLPGRGPDQNMRANFANMTNIELTGILGKKLSVDELNNRNRLLRTLEIKMNEDNVAPDFPFIPEWLIIGTLFDRAEVRRRIAKRLRERLDAGMLNEVAELHKKGLSWEKLEYFGLEYKYAALNLQGRISDSEMESVLFVKIRQFARRQDTWFRKIEREGHKIYWIKEGSFRESEKLSSAFLSGENIPDPQIKLSQIFYGKKTS